MVRRIIEAAMACHLDIPTTILLMVQDPYLLGILPMPYLETHLGLGTNNNNMVHHSPIWAGATHPLPGAMDMGLGLNNLLILQG